MNWLKKKARSFLNSLYRFNTRIKNGYLQFYDIFYGSWRWVHRKVAQIMTGTIPKGYEVHHKNRNKLDNDPDNLQVLSKEEHRKIHKNDKKKNTKKIDKTLKKLNKIKNRKPFLIEKPINNNLLSLLPSLLNNNISFNNMYNNDEQCWKCGGSGYLSEYSHYCNGVCFACNGGDYPHDDENAYNKDYHLDQERYEQEHHIEQDRYEHDRFEQEHHIEQDRYEHDRFEQEYHIEQERYEQDRLEEEHHIEEDRYEEEYQEEQDRFEEEHSNYNDEYDSYDDYDDGYDNDYYDDRY